MTQVHDILDAINEARTALDERPQLKSYIQELETNLRQSQTHAQALEVNIQGYKSDISGLTDKIRSLEVERDDAGFRELEAQDKLDALRNVVLGVHTTLEKTLPKAEPIVEAPVVNEVAPQAGTTSVTIEPTPEPTPGSTLYGSSYVLVPETQAQSNPIPTPEPNRPYSGKAYNEQPMVSRTEWIEGGGTDYGYWNESTNSDFDRSKC